MSNCRFHLSHDLRWHVIASPSRLRKREAFGVLDVLVGIEPRKRRRSGRDFLNAVGECWQRTHCSPMR